MSLRFDGGQEGDIILVNQCTNCFRFLKNSALPQPIKINGFGQVIEPLMAECPRCGSIKLEWFRD
jgi:hypothetical protein